MCPGIGPGHSRSRCSPPLYQFWSVFALFEFLRGASCSRCFRPPNNLKGALNTCFKEAPRSVPGHSLGTHWNLCNMRSSLWDSCGQFAGPDESCGNTFWGLVESPMFCGLRAVHVCSRKGVLVSLVIGFCLQEFLGGAPKQSCKQMQGPTLAPGKENNKKRHVCGISKPFAFSDSA